MLSLYSLSIFLFLGGIFSQRHHFLMCLLSLELCMMSVYVCCLSSLGLSIPTSPNLALVVLSLTVAEAMMGLGLLVCRSRSVGGDSLGSLFSLGS
uniref:NADH-ubiquinone oxidoreductase chain 4L n=1 Tax=Scrobicularia plana TaxID=665965 RepID=A0A6H2U263_9BIVA|nr:NADH dehydrogenase subunit 4L [Scrobicularia plana]